MRIYTRTGDQGETSLWGRQGLKRVSKDDVRVEAVGCIDEANAFMGLASSVLERIEPSVGHDVCEAMEWVQHRLFGLGSDVANVDMDRHCRIGPEDISRMEAWIDGWEGELAPLTAFILPKGSEPVACLHVVRTVVRRAERRLVRQWRNDPVLGEDLRFLNRLSDLLFVMARLVGQRTGVPEQAARF